jgi:3-(3-hydroxy-phenyl)propionate hydroxylase
VQDIDNLIWKLKCVINEKAPVALIDSYHEERAFAADDNLLNSTRSTDFITPKTHTSRVLRDAVLQLAETEPFSRSFVNSGRLSTPTPYQNSSLNTPDTTSFEGLMRPGTNCADAPVLLNGKPAWLLNQLGDGFTLMVFGDISNLAPNVNQIDACGMPIRILRIGDVNAQNGSFNIIDAEGLVWQRYDAKIGTVYLIRPDQHVAARWREFDQKKIETALARCLAH